MAQSSQHQDETRRDPEVAHFRRPGAGTGPLRITVHVPPLVEAVLKKAKKDVSAEINRVIAALFRKLTPERGPSPYAGEVHYFERVLNTPTESLTPVERSFVLLVQAHQAHEELLVRVKKQGASDAVRREIELAEGLLAELVNAALEVVRIDRGEETAQLEWEITEP